MFKNRFVWFLLGVLLASAGGYVVAVDPYAVSYKAIDGPATDFALMTDVDSDSVNLVTTPRAMLALTAGTFKVTTFDGTDRTITLSAGQQVNLRILRIWITGTTGTGYILY